MNAKLFSEEAVQFHNLRFKNNVKIHPTSNATFFRFTDVLETRIKYVA